MAGEGGAQGGGELLALPGADFRGLQFGVERLRGAGEALEASHRPEERGVEAQVGAEVGAPFLKSGERGALGLCHSLDERPLGARAALGRGGFALGERGADGAPVAADENGAEAGRFRKIGGGVGREEDERLRGKDVAGRAVQPARFALAEGAKRFEDG